jgi:hypothetical protein
MDGRLGNPDGETADEGSVAEGSKDSAASVIIGEPSGFNPDSPR